jgi:YVTN family beta-propeller protein
VTTTSPSSTAETLPPWLRWGPGKSGSVVAGALAADAEDRAVYVVNNPAETVAILDADTHIVRSTIPVGNLPNTVALGDKPRTAYVINRGDDSVTTIRDGAVQGTVAVGKAPGSAAAGPDDHALDVCNTGEPSLSVVDLTTRAVTAVTLTDFPALAPDPHAMFPLPEDPAKRSVNALAADPDRHICSSRSPVSVAATCLSSTPGLTGCATPVSLLRATHDSPWTPSTRPSMSPSRGRSSTASPVSS